MKTIYNILSWLPATLWYWVIWGFSAQTATVSGALSDRLLWRLIAVLSPSFVQADLATQNTVVELLSYFERKAAHMFLYFTLALLIWLALVRLMRGKFPQMALTFFLCAVLAGLDEFHQTYVSGRSGQLKDVAIDLVGAGIALALLGVLFLTARWRTDHHSGPLALLPVMLCVLLMVLVAAFPGNLSALPPFIWAAQQFIPNYINLSSAGQADLLSAMAPVLGETLYLLSCALLGCGAMLTAALTGLSLRFSLPICLTACGLLGEGIALFSGLPVALLGIGCATIGVLPALVLWWVCLLWTACARGIRLL